MTEPTHLLWLDFEGTGTDPVADAPIEVAAILTDRALNEVARYASIIVPPPAAMARLMRNPSALRIHIDNALLPELFDAIAAERVVTAAAAEEDILAILDAADAGTVVLAGSGVGHYDAPMIQAHMPLLASRLAYYVHDVGVLRRHHMRVLGTDPVDVNSTKTHRALDDIEGHLREGRAYDALTASLAGA